MKGYGVRVTTIEGQNTFAPTMLCFMPKIHMTDDQNTWSDYEWLKVQTQAIKLCSVYSIHS